MPETARLTNEARRCYQLMAPTLSGMKRRGKGKVKVDKSQEGCWFDSYRGRYIGEMVIATARAEGWKMCKAGFKLEDAYVESNQYHDCWASAEDFLARLAPKGFYIGENDGDFGMYKIEEDECN